MLQDGITEEPNSPRVSPISTVPKPDDSPQLCNHFRKLKQVSEFNSYPKLRVEDFTESLGRVWFISTLDFIKGYWQVSFTPSNRPKTTFGTTTDPWQCQVLMRASVTFPFLIDTILQPHRLVTSVTKPSTRSPEQITHITFMTYWVISAGLVEQQNLAKPSGAHRGTVPGPLH